MTGSLERKKRRNRKKMLLVGLALACSTFEVLSNDCLLGNRVASVVREIVFHKCGLDLIPLSKICLDCVCPFPSLLEETFLKGYCGFPLSPKPKI